MEEKKIELSWTELEPYCLLKWVLRNVHMVILSAVFFLLAANILIHLCFQMQYNARVTFVVASRSSYASSSMDASTANSVAASFTELLQSSTVQKKIETAAGLSSFSGKIEAANTEDTNLITVTVTASTAKQAYLMLEAIMNNYDELTVPIFGNAIINVLSAPTVSGYSTMPYSERQIQKMAVLFGAALMIVFLLYECIREDTVQTAKGAERKLDGKLLLSVPHERSTRGRKRRPVRITEPTVSFAFAESIHRLRAKIEHQRQDVGLNTFLLTSVAEHEGKSLLVENLALSLVQRHRAVLIMDCDLRKPSRFQAGSKRKNAAGSAWKVEKEYTSGKYHLCLARNTNNNLYALYSQSQMTDPSEFLTSGIFTDFLNQLIHVFSFILIDTPPLGLFSDAELLADLAGTSMLVVRQGVTPAPVINDAIDTLRSSKSQFLGCILNDTQTLLPESLTSSYGYGDGYGSRGYGKYGKYGVYGRSTHSAASESKKKKEGQS